MLIRQSKTKQMNKQECNISIHLSSVNKIIVLFYLIINSAVVLSNNIQINNVARVSQNIVTQTSLIKFDLNWDNSWRVNSGPSNWDAAWVFVKYRKNNETLWNHMHLNYVDGSGVGDGHIVPANATISSVDDNGNGTANGVFVYNNVNVPQSNVAFNGIELLWNYGADGLQVYDSIEICVFAIEMVYIPQGSFSIGSGGSETNHFYSPPVLASSYSITSENAIPVANATGSLYYLNTNSRGGDRQGPIPNAFPKGFNAFYFMKYEITHGQYADFLSKLTAGQVTLNVNSSTTNRHSIVGTLGNYSSLNPEVPYNYLTWRNLCAYLEWAALRPISELEFEKAARGNVAPVPNEYPWGTTTVNTVPYTYNNLGLANEGVATNFHVTSGNAFYGSTDDNINGPIRVGIFPANALNTGKITAGASFYGVMNMMGNLWERVITVGNVWGRNFTGQHGDGTILGSGAGSVSEWTPWGAEAAGSRGSSIVRPASMGRVSDRTISNLVLIGADYSYGGRGGRTAP